MIFSIVVFFCIVGLSYWLELQVETGKKTLILHGTKTSGVLNEVLTEIYHLKKESAVKYSRRNEGIKPFENGGDSSLEFFSLKTDCSIIVVRNTEWFQFLITIHFSHSKVFYLLFITKNDFMWY